MRIYEDNFAYEVEQIIDRATQVPSGWRYNIHRVRPNHQILRSGDAATKEAAEKAGKRALARVIRAEQKVQSVEGKGAA